MPQNTRKSCHGQYDWLHPMTLTKLIKLRERNKRKSLEINNLEVNPEFDDIIKVLNEGRRNSVNTNSWKPLFC